MTVTAEYPHIDDRGLGHKAQTPWASGTEEDVLWWRRARSRTPDHGKERAVYGFDERYVWNWGLLQDFMMQDVDPFWTVHLMQGWIAHAIEKVRFSVPQDKSDAESKATRKQEELKCEFLLISRRRRLRGGVRFLCRGIDDDGDCGNCVESEMLVSTFMHTFSFVQMRGTVPLFWEQKQHGLVSEINTLRPELLTKPVFVRHFQQLNELYGKVLLINLVRKNKTDEHTLTEALIKMFHLIKNSDDEADKTVQKNVKHVMFDFHS